MDEERRREIALDVLKWFVAEEWNRFNPDFLAEKTGVPLQELEEFKKDVDKMLFEERIDILKVLSPAD